MVREPNEFLVVKAACFSLWMEVVCEIMKAVDIVLIVEVVIVSVGITGAL